MGSIRRAVPSVLLSCLLLAGCSSGSHSGPGTSNKGGASAAGPSASGVPAGTAKIPVGAGPQTTYTVQQQPPAGSCRYRYEKGEPLPDPKCTPGAISPAVTQANLATTICRKGGYTKNIRPPEAITSKEKQANAASYGYKGSFKDAEYDHLLSLTDGGDPNDARNLWVQPPDPGHKPGSGVNNLKDPVETKVHTAICSGKVTLTAAQNALVTDWTTALNRLGIG
ncbi:hypothetical protein AB0L75_41350 [Streptomyces sp. NPDC052101]|uniref:hypothetical protein n=1 Tax=Streptomyces sp. NPDC052101 TaxID=3155763 RepID=UPI003436AA87